MAHRDIMSCGRSVSLTALSRQAALSLQPRAVTSTVTRPQGAFRRADPSTVGKAATRPDSESRPDRVARPGRPGSRRGGRHRRPDSASTKAAGAARLDDSLIGRNLGQLAARLRPSRGSRPDAREGAVGRRSAHRYGGSSYRAGMSSVPSPFGCSRFENQRASHESPGAGRQGSKSSCERGRSSIRPQLPYSPDLVESSSRTPITSLPVCR